jgi:Reverse transcriptase (RNA-dependent DNA polymerase)
VELETLSKYVEEKLRKGYICHSQSPYGAPVVFVKKDGTLRVCVDYRSLNKLTVKNCYPMHLIGELLDCISRAKVLSKFDVRDGYNCLRMAAGEEEKGAFWCRYGLFEYVVMPFSLCNTPGTFQHYINNTFWEFLDKFLVIYLDNFLVYLDNLKGHKQHVRQVLERCQEAGLYLKQSKCEFHKEELKFLGFIVGKNRV